MDPEIRSQFALLNQKLDAVRTAVEKTRRYIFWSGVAQLLLIVLPLIGLAVAIPWLISTLTRPFEGLL